MSNSIKFDCKTHHIDKNGEVPILIRVHINGAKGYINTGKKVHINDLDNSRKALKKGTKNSSLLNSFVIKQISRVNSIIEEYESRNEVVTFNKVKDQYFKDTGKVKSECFYQFVEDRINWELHTSSVTKGTLNNYLGNLKKLKEYSKKLSIHDIDKTFLEEYKHYILHTLKQAPNTAYHAMCFLRKYTKILFDEGRIKPYPFAKFEVGKNFEANRDYLEPEELDKLQVLYDSGKLTEIVKKAKSKHAQDFNIGIKYQQVLRYFLVACYCGLRHSDIKTLNKNDIKGDFIVKEMQKGRRERKKTVRIPLTKRLTDLLDFNNPKGLLFENPVMETSQTNKYLRAIMSEAGINKHITFHCSRHTFAVISLIKGIPIVVVSNILGHSELTTTQRYAKVVDRLKQEEMKKWDEAIQAKQKIECKYCHNTLLETEFGAIAMKKVILVCNKCGKSGNYSMK